MYSIVSSITILEGQFQIVDSNGNPGYQGLGLLLYNGGTVCGNNGYFNSYAATSICRVLGYLYYSTYDTGYRDTIQDNYQITLDDVYCSSSNYLWKYCSYNFEVSDCSHNYDVHLHCSSGIIVHSYNLNQ